MIFTDYKFFFYCLLAYLPDSPLPSFLNLNISLHAPCPGVFAPCTMLCARSYELLTPPPDTINLICSCD